MADRDPANLTLFGRDMPERLGHARVSSKDVSSILTKATGFMGAYDFTLNPYSGCSFGCTYCYAAFFARQPKLRDDWGHWVHVKRNAVQLLRRMRTDIRGKTIYMSSVTDPYQPIEPKIELVRDLLAELVRHQPRLVVQTRSHHVTRDVELLRRFDHVCVNMTITTDSERVRRVFEPYCPGLRRRIEAIRTIHEAGIPTRITLTPLLPLDDPEAFARALAETGVQRFVVQPFHAERGRFVAGTRDAARQLIADMGWGEDQYRSAVATLRRTLPSLEEGKEGFAPV